MDGGTVQSKFKPERMDVIDYGFDPVWEVVLKWHKRAVGVASWVPAVINDNPLVSLQTKEKERKINKE